MKVLFLAAEAAPLVKVGGLGDYAGELPTVLRRSQVDLLQALPRYACVRDEELKAVEAGTVVVPCRNGSHVADLLLTTLGPVPLLLVDGEPLRASEAVYGEPGADAFRFTFFSIAALKACQAFGWAPDLIHAHDWHAAPAVIWLARHRQEDPFWRHTAALLTVHNLPYLGVGGEDAMAEFGLIGGEVSELPRWASALPLPLGLLHADGITTVSPGYAEEILTPEFGCGLGEFLASRRQMIHGILNGLDPGRWDPSRDPALRIPFSVDDLERRRGNKRHLQAEMGLTEAPDIPVLGMVSRVDPQKGIDIAVEALRALSNLPWQLVVLGTGEPKLEGLLSEFAQSFPDRARITLSYEPGLSRRIYAGSDIILIPSRYEPCGIAQMIAMRYGAVPVVRSVGGLRDTVIDASQHEDGTGFVFKPLDPAALAEVLRRAFIVRRNSQRWAEIQVRCMTRDFSWDRQARQYLDVYQKTVDRMIP